MLASKLLLIACLLSLANPASADYAAASTAMGGIRLVREPRVSMAKERLFISLSKVRVEFEFLNETDNDITTEVAFPIPRYGYDYHEHPRASDDFRVWVDGREVKYAIEVKAESNGRDCTELLRGLGIDATTFGHIGYKKPVVRDLQRLPRNKVAELERAGLLSTDDHLPLWTVQKTYHWRQTFPSRRILRVRHDYAPVTGWMVMSPELMDPYTPEQVEDAKKERVSESDQLVQWVRVPEMMSNSCFGLEMSARIKAEAEAAFAKGERAAHKFHDMNPHDMLMYWVDYILTTANTWKTPILDFEMIVGTPKPPKKEVAPYVSFCWDGPIERPDPFHDVARAKNFVPTRELHVAFVAP